MWCNDYLSIAWKARRLVATLSFGSDYLGQQILHLYYGLAPIFAIFADHLWIPYWQSVWAEMWQSRWLRLFLSVHCSHENTLVFHPDRVFAFLCGPLLQRTKGGQP